MSCIRNVISGTLAKWSDIQMPFEYRTKFRRIVNNIPFIFDDILRMYVVSMNSR